MSTGMRYKVAPSYGENLVALSAKSILDLKRMVKEGDVTAKDLVDFLEDCYNKVNKNEYY